MENQRAILTAAYSKLKEENPKTRIRDAAKQLGVTEVDLVATNPDNIRLKDEFEDILKQVPGLG